MILTAWILVDVSAKMYFNEIMAGRYDPMPNATAFPNHVDDGYKGMLVVRSEIKSMFP